MPELDGDAPLGGDQLFDGLSDKLGAIYDQVQAEDAGEAAAPAAAPAEAEKPAGGPVRDPATGKFTRAEGATDGDAAKEPGKEPAKTDAAAKGSDAAPQPPAAWSAEEKAEFAKLPPELQRSIARRETERETAFFGKTNELAEQRKRFDRLEQVIGARREHWLKSGMDEATAVGQLIVLADMADRDFSGFVKHLAEVRGFDLRQLVEEPAGEDDGDPRYAALEKEVKELRARVAGREQAEANAADAEKLSHIKAFSEDPKHPHFEAVRLEMAALMRAAGAKGQTLSLEAAYERACWSDEGVRKQLQAEADKAAAAARETEEKRRAKEAKEAAGTRVNTRGSMPGRQAKGTWLDTMGAAYDRMQGAA